MIWHLKIFLLLLIPYPLLGQGNPDHKIKTTISSDLQNGLFYNGHVRVREQLYEGTYLKLKNNLGMNSWFSVGGTISVDIDRKNCYEFSYKRQFFGGTEILPDSTRYNGALYAPHSNSDISRTVYTDFECTWKTKISDRIKTDIYLRTALHYERLKFYVDAPIDKSSPLTEIYEAFWRQELPLPAIGIYIRHDLSARWLLTGEAYASYLPAVKTWMQEGGAMYLSQSNADVRLDLLYRYKFLSLNVGMWFKHFRIKEESREDENEFLLNGAGTRASVLFSF